MMRSHGTGFLLTALLPLIAASAVAQPARVERVDIIHYNIAGATRSHGSFPIIGRIIDEVQRRRPDVISLNEICSNQYDHLRGQLQRIGYTMHGHFHRALSYNPDCNRTGVESDGNALFVRGEVLRTDNYYFDKDRGHALRHGNNPSVGTRWQSVACTTTRFNNPGLPVKVCVTHLGKDDANGRSAQAAQLARVFAPEARQTPFILAGDLNLPINDPLLDPFYNPGLMGDGPFSEVSTSVTYEDDGAGERAATATHAKGKLDYIFLSSHFWPIVSASEVAEHTQGCDGTCSDHKMLYGAARWVGRLRVLHSGMCLVARAGWGERPVVQVGCADYSDQDWILSYLQSEGGPEGRVQVIHRDRGLCLVTRGINVESKAVVSTCDARFNDQLWDVRRDPNTGYYQLRNVNSGLCLVVRTGNAEAQAIQSTCNTQWADQLWLWDAWFK